MIRYPEPIEKRYEEKQLARITFTNDISKILLENSTVQMHKRE